MIPKRKRFRSRRLLDAAEGRSCVLCEYIEKHTQVDQGADPTVVPAHLPGSFYGMPAGTGGKTHDWLVAHVCGKHHEMLDGPEWRLNTDVRMLALCLTLERLFEDEVIVVKR